MSDYLSDLEAACEEFTVTIDEFAHADPEKLVAVLHVIALARGSGVPIDQRT